MGGYFTMWSDASSGEIVEHCNSKNNYIEGVFCVASETATIIGVEPLVDDSVACCS
jgi:hypothetical protein